MNVSTMKQLSISVCYVDSAWAIKEEFLGLHATPKCDLETLTTIIKSCPLSLNLPLSNWRGQAYDGAANMRGNISGVQARIKESKHNCHVCLLHGSSIKSGCPRMHYQYCARRKRSRNP